jgi:solute carrier family 44 protein 1 (choline transporter-like protein)
MVILPITQAIFISGTIGALAIGAVAIYSMGAFTFPDNIAFPVVSFTQGELVLLAFFLTGALWTLFWLQGCNHFTLCSAVSIWYFNHENTQNAGNPFCDSIGRLIRYHLGSVAFTSLINGLFFVVKLICQIFSFEVKDEDNRCTAYFLRCLNCFFCIFRM